MKKKLLWAFGILVVLGLPIVAQTPEALNIDVDSFLKPNTFSQSVNLLLGVTLITLIPFFLVSCTCFLRTVMVLSLMRQAIGTQQSPPNSVIISLAIFMTIFVMTPTWTEVSDIAVKPYNEGRITQREALELGIKPFRNFMIKHTRDQDLALFLEFSQIKRADDYESIPIYVLIPAFIISELKAAFQIAFLLFIPFIVIDLIVSNILLSLGMFMLSPAMISLPFKILLFVLTDGWNLIIRGLLVSFIQPT